jgi:hypothetical protein
LNWNSKIKFSAPKPSGITYCRLICSNGVLELSGLKLFTLRPLLHDLEEFVVTELRKKLLAFKEVCDVSVYQGHKGARGGAVG